MNITVWPVDANSIAWHRILYGTVWDKIGQIEKQEQAEMTPLFTLEQQLSPLVAL